MFSIDKLNKRNKFCKDQQEELCGMGSLQVSFKFNQILKTIAKVTS